MKKKEIHTLLNEISELYLDYHHICHKAPKLKEQMQEISIEEVPKELRDEFDDALREIEYIENSL